MSTCRGATVLAPMAKPLDLGLEERLLKARIQYVAQLKEALLDSDSLLHNTLEVYTSIIDGVSGRPGTAGRASVGFQDA